MSTKATVNDFASNQPVRWCPGCGDYAVLKSLQKILAEATVPRENQVFISGIGCAGRLPYYLNTYGLHGLHGRAPAIATGLKLSRPDLSVWVITGDGDALSIGGNHLLHCLRRDININILLFNNRVYGLTKGQYSPTSAVGQITPTSPLGVVDQPVNPIRFALSAGASFVARVIDVDAPGLEQVLTAAQKHQGASFVEIYQNCPVFNDKAFEAVRDKNTRADNMLWCQANEPLVFGKEQQKALRWEGDQPIIVDALNQKDLKTVAHHQPQAESLLPSMRLAELPEHEFPTPFGILRQVEKPKGQNVERNPLTKSTLNTLLRSGTTWEVSA